MTPLEIINARVKALQKKHPNAKRSTLQKQAGKEYRAGKLSRSTKTKAPAKRKSTAPRASSSAVHSVSKATAATLKGELKRRIIDSIDKAVLKKYHATKKRDKAKYQKEITAKKNELKKLI